MQQHNTRSPYLPREHCHVSVLQCVPSRQSSPVLSLNEIHNQQPGKTKVNIQWVHSVWKDVQPVLPAWSTPP